jgi:hypothetical protein
MAEEAAEKAAEQLAKPGGISRRARLLRIGLGFVLAPLTPIAALLAISIGGGGIEWHQSLLLIVIGVPAVYVPALVLGVPMFLIMRWRGWNGMLAYVWAGALIAMIIWLVSGLLVPAKPHGVAASLLLQARGFLPVLLACAMAVSSAFWGIARPDRFDEVKPASNAP